MELGGVFPAALPPERVCAPRRGIEIITLPGATAPHAVGRTRRTEKPPGTRSGRRLTLENIQLPVERLFPPPGGVSRGSVRVGGKTFLLPFYGFSFGYKRKGVNVTLLIGTASDIVGHLICANTFWRQSRGWNGGSVYRNKKAPLRAVFHSFSCARSPKALARRIRLLFQYRGAGRKTCSGGRAAVGTVGAFTETKKRPCGRFFVLRFAYSSGKGSLAV